MTFKEWMEKQYDKQELKDMIEHGVDGGFSGLIYYSETVELFEEHKEEIFDKLVEQAEEFGHANVYEMLGTFYKDHMPGNYSQFANQLVWYMAEETAREIIGDDQ
ncbi:MAG TPA: hypothetical protein ENH82_07985 [bacterium]|nr:hypothetical protein [bacterium]